jgi:hypothetical protein
VASAIVERGTERGKLSGSSTDASPQDEAAVERFYRVDSFANGIG